MDAVIVTTTTASDEEARVLASGAIEARLGACAQIVGPITSIYHWDGAVQQEPEWRVEIKTASDQVSALIEHITARHDYDVPEVVATPIVTGSADYLAWVREQTRADAR